MVNDKERVTKADSYHMFIAIRRKKENRDRQEMVFRQIIQNEHTDLEILRAKLRRYSGIW